jgi:general secretion pathway protein D
MKKLIFTVIGLGCILNFSISETAPAQADAAVKDLPADEKAQAIEIVRRQELVFRSQKAIEEGQKSESLGEYVQAQERFRFALTSLVKSDETQAVVSQAGSGLARVNYELSKEALRNQKWDVAQKLLEEAQAADPSNEEVDGLLQKVKASASDVKLAGSLINPALTPKFLESLKTVDELLVVSDQYFKTGQYDEALTVLKKVQTIDPYNKAALERTSKVIDEKKKYFSVAQEQTREKRILDTEEKWSVKPKRKVEGKVDDVAQTVLVKSNKFGINEKLKSIVLPELNFRGASIIDAANFLSSKSRELDKKDKKGIQIIVQEDAKRNAKEVNLSLKNIPLGEALRYVCRVSDVKFKVEEFAIVVIPLSAPETVLITRIFNVSPTFINTVSSASAEDKAAPSRRVAAAATTSEGGSNAEAMNQLREKGVDFPPGSTAVYSPTQGTLAVTNTQDQIDLIEELVNADSGQSLVVDVTVKVVEIGQEDLNELTNNLNFKLKDVALAQRIASLSSIGEQQTAGVPTFGRSPAVNTGLRGSQGFRVNGLDNVIGGANTSLATPNALKLGISGLTGSELQTILTAIAQKKSSDFLASPTVRVKAGSKALLNNARRMPYPVSFDKPKVPSIQVPAQSTTFPAAAFVPSFPNSFEFKDIGVKMEVQPQVPADKSSVELALAPDIVDFDGFINYGESLNIVDGAGLSTAFSSNTINQPVFVTRKIQTRVTVKDKYTFVLAGLGRDDIQKTEDKIPILGDLPFVGSAFRSKAVKTTKKNLLIFVTPRILLPDGTPLNPDVLPLASR